MHPLQLCPACRAKNKPDEIEAQWLRECGRDVPAVTWSPVGSPACNNLGFHGRIGIFETWQLTEDDYARILRHEDEQGLRHGLVERGQMLMLDDGLAKVDQGQTTLRELLRTGVLLSHHAPSQAGDKAKPASFGKPVSS